MLWHAGLSLAIYQTFAAITEITTQRTVEEWTTFRIDTVGLR
jgi:hypothetical protein